MKFLEVNNLDIEYQTRKETIYASKNVSFNLQRGEIIGIVGESGSGKSTVANAIINLIDKPGIITNGSIKLDGRELHNDKDIIKNIRGKKIAGKKVIHHSPENKKLLPNLIKVPKEGFVGGKPTPKKLRVDSVIIACDSPIVAITNTGLKIFGSICLNIITIFERPIILEAKIYSLFFSTRVAALVTLANCGHSEIPIAKIRTYIAISSWSDFEIKPLAMPSTNNAINMLGIVS